jgi:hypothetical protein
MSIVDKAKVYAEKAADAAAKATAAGKEKIDDARAQKKLHDLYADVGRLVVAQRRGGPEVEVEVSGKIAQINAIEHELGLDEVPPAASA